MHHHGRLTAALVCTLLAPLAAHAQGIGGPTILDSKVGYIDAAIPGNQVRLRFDAAYNSNRPTRAEYFYAQGSPAGGPGLPLPEPSVDYQELSLMVERALSPDFSVFVDVPTRFLNPEVNDNAWGLSDTIAGFKYAFLNCPDQTVSFQFRVFAPTGEADRGLGTRHASVEPGLLWYRPITERLSLEGEARIWIPIGGTDFAGEVVRYGLGAGYDLTGPNSPRRVALVTEFLGWTVLSGEESIVNPTGPGVIADAAGDTIINLKCGVRVGVGQRSNVYVGYGRALTGEHWYEDIVRLEYRLSY